MFDKSKKICPPLTNIWESLRNYWPYSTNFWNCLLYLYKNPGHLQLSRRVLKKSLILLGICLYQTSVIIKNNSVFLFVGLTMHATILAHMFSLVETNKVSEPLFPAGSVQYPSNQVSDIIILRCPTTTLYRVTMNRAKLCTFFSHTVNSL